jgi:trimeric autotransporter adhesin
MKPSNTQLGVAQGDAHMCETTDPLRAWADGSVAQRTAIWARSVVPSLALALAALLSVALGVALSRGLASHSSTPPPSESPGLSTHNGLSALPLAAQGPVSAALGVANPAYMVKASGTGFQGVSPRQRLGVRFESSGVLVDSGTLRAGLSLRAVGYGGSRQAVGDARPSASANRVIYARTGLSEWYANGPLGLEQGFTVPRAPTGHAARTLTLSMALSGNAHAALASGAQSITLSHAGASSLRYGGLLATDARGRTLHSWLQIHAGTLLLRVDTRGARYPLRIDPYIQQGKKLAATGENGKGQFGYSVALSSTAKVALIGAPSNNGGEGAAWVFTRSGMTWTQSEKLTASNETGKGRFGSNVALSGDGKTALIGGPSDNGEVGAAWVFTRAGSSWTQGETLTGNGTNGTGRGENGNGRFGSGVALSKDGKTALIGGPGDNGGVGAAWVFRRAGSTWTQKGEKLIGGGEIDNGAFGFSVALSSNGNTALVGAPSDRSCVGAAWVFLHSGSIWKQQAELQDGQTECPEPDADTDLGYSVALSADGDTALLGAPPESEFGESGGWVFIRMGSTWTEQAGLLGFDGGASVALSSDGNTALIAGPLNQGGFRGTAFVLTRVGSTWTQVDELNGRGEPEAAFFGHSAALSASGETALIGGSGGKSTPNGVGAAWVFVESNPLVAGVGP